MAKHNFVIREYGGRKMVLIDGVRVKQAMHIEVSPIEPAAIGPVVTLRFIPDCITYERRDEPWPEDDE